MVYSQVIVYTVYSTVLVRARKGKQITVQSLRGYLENWEPGRGRPQNTFCACGLSFWDFQTVGALGSQSFNRASRTRLQIRNNLNAKRASAWRTTIHGVDSTWGTGGGSPSGPKIGIRGRGLIATCCGPHGTVYTQGAQPNSSDETPHAHQFTRTASSMCPRAGHAV